MRRCRYAPNAASSFIDSQDRPAENGNVTTHAIPLSFVASADPCTVDEFERAARVLSFTGQLPIQTDPVASAAVPASAHVARRRTGLAFKRVAAASFTLG
ncbi:MAG: hypothetical protein ACO1OB_13010, partial [Archangium sp.]